MWPKRGLGGETRGDLKQLASAPTRVGSAVQPLCGWGCLSVPSLGLGLPCQPVGASRSASNQPELVSVVGIQGTRPELREREREDKAPGMKVPAPRREADGQQAAHVREHNEVDG